MNQSEDVHSCGFHCTRPGCVEARAKEWEEQRKRIKFLEAEREAADKYIKSREKDCYEYDEKVRLLEAERDKLKAKAERYEQMLFHLGAMEEPPCFGCGYNGKGYYQPDQHPCAARHHAALDAAKEKK